MSPVVHFPPSPGVEKLRRAYTEHWFNRIPPPGYEVVQFGNNRSHLRVEGEISTLCRRSSKEPMTFPTKSLCTACRKIVFCYGERSFDYYWGVRKGVKWLTI